LINFGKKLLKYDGTTVTRYPLLDDGLVNIAGKGASWIAANGGKLFDFPSNPTKFMMDQPETLGALQYLQDLIWQHKLVPNADDYAKYDFRKGTASMYMDGTGALARHVAAIGSTFEFDLARRPVGKANRGYLLASDMWGITSSCKNKDAAWRFVKYLASRESAEAYGRIIGRGPVRRSAFPAFRDAYRGYNIDVHAEAMSEAIISPDTFMYKTSQANSLINTAAKEIRGNVKDPKTAIGGIVDAMRALYQ
jgi:multiple sugar transport system substrate-binding protein